jgi:hypothetical protein
MQKIRITITAILAVIFCLLTLANTLLDPPFLNLTIFKFAIGSGLIFAVYMLFEKNEALLIVFGPGLLFVGILLFILCYGIAHIFGKNLIDVFNNYKPGGFSYLIIFIPRASVMMAMWGLCVSVALSITVIIKKIRA